MHYILIDLKAFQKNNKNYYCAYLYCKNEKTGFLKTSFIDQDTFSQLVGLGDAIMYHDITEYCSVYMSSNTYNINIKL